MVLIDRTVSVGSGGGSLQADNTDIRTSRDSTLNLCVGHDISMILVLFLVVRGSRQASSSLCPEVGWIRRDATAYLLVPQLTRDIIHRIPAPMFARWWIALRLFTLQPQLIGSWQASH